MASFYYATSGCSETARVLEQWRLQEDCLVAFPWPVGIIVIGNLTCYDCGWLDLTVKVMWWVAVYSGL